MGIYAILKGEKSLLGKNKILATRWEINKMEGGDGWKEDENKEE